MTDLITAHKPSIEDVGTTVTFVDRRTLKSGSRDVTFERVQPKPDEKVIPLDSASNLFAHLQQINVILTNACNLSCTYCYEQHRKDFGRFDVPSLKRLYDFFVKSNDVRQKNFTFFGGEPLAQKDLILNFLETYAEELQANHPQVSVSMVTNGLLLTPEFVSKYFSYPFVKLVVSLDTDRADIDHRELTQAQIDELLEQIQSIPQSFKDQKSVCVRCTISKETAPYLNSFVKGLHARGVRSFVIHPLTMSLKSGFIEWDEYEWITLLNDMTELLELDNILIQFSEGIGLRGHSNCMVGSDMIAVDASGDYSGCYFFTNQKVALADATLGNLLDGKVYVDRYKDFSTQYDELFEAEECKTCDLNNLCYQCPAGNLVTGGKMFRPDGMCKSVVRLFNLLQDTITKKGFFGKFGRLKEAIANEGAIVMSRALIHLLFHHSTGHKLTPRDIEKFSVKGLPPYSHIAAAYMQDTKYLNIDNLLNIAREPIQGRSMKDLYEFVVSSSNKPVFVSQGLTATGLEVETFYLTLLHFFILNTKGNKLETAAETMIVYDDAD